MKVYLAGRYDRREELSHYAEVLLAVGFPVTSRWLDGSHEGATEPETLAWCAGQDFDDIAEADVFVAFTEADRNDWHSGGRHVELGYALGHDMPIVLVGEPENVFHHLPFIDKVATWDEALLLLMLRRHP